MNALLIAALLATAGLAAAAPCPVPAFDNGDGAPAALDAADPTCALANDPAHRRAFERLRDAAAIPPAELQYVVWVGAESENASYWQKRVGYNDAYLKKHSPGSKTPLATMAHEIGHAVQDRLGVLYPAGYDAMPERRQKSYSRQIEAHADSIGVELLLKAGFPPDTFVEGRVVGFTCAAISEPDDDDPKWTHPADRHRWVNSLLATPRVSAELIAQHRARLEGLGRSKAELDRAFTGAAGGGGEPDPVITVPLPRAYQPSFRVSDFDDRGRLQPGRRVTTDLSLDPPPPNAGVVRTHATQIVASSWDRVAGFVGDTVDWWYRRESLGDLAVRACGKATGNEFQGAVLYGISDWSREAAERSAAWLARRK